MLQMLIFSEQLIWTRHYFNTRLHFTSFNSQQCSEVATLTTYFCRLKIRKWEKLSNLYQVATQVKDAVSDSRAQCLNTMLCSFPVGYAPSYFLFPNICTFPVTKADIFISTFTNKFVVWKALGLDWGQREEVEDLVYLQRALSLLVRIIPTSSLCLKSKLSPKDYFSLLLH